MKKLILLSLLSFNSFAKELVDLSEDRVYYCTDNDIVQAKGGGRALTEGRLTIKVKDSVITMSRKGARDLTWSKGQAFIAASMIGSHASKDRADSIFLRRMDETGKLNFFINKNFIIGTGGPTFKNSVPTSQDFTSQGTCVLF